MNIFFKQIHSASISLLFVFVIVACAQSPSSKNAQKSTEAPSLQARVEPISDNSPKTPPQTTIGSPIMKLTGATSGWNKNLMVDDVPYDLYIPSNYGHDANGHVNLPCILVLPGWDYPRTQWVEDTPLVEYANRYGYALILPEMLVTLYESSYYDESFMKWHPIPGGQFIKERFIPTIQQRHNLLTPGKHNTLLGFSTGGRGVALIALENPDLFVAGASLAGDFSQENMPNDNLMTAVYGPFDQFRDRWMGRDNPQARVAEWTMPLYLAHGREDSIVPTSQSRLFYEALIGHHGEDVLVKYEAIAGAGHDDRFLSQQLPSVFEFFENISVDRN